MRGHLLGDLQAPAVLEVGRDAGGAEGVAADLGLNSGRGRPAADHPPHIRLLHGLDSELARAAARGAKQRTFPVLPDAGRRDILMEVLVKVVVRGHGVLLAALLMQAHPAAALLDVVILDPHAGGRADAGECVAHERDEGAVAQPEQGAGVDGGEQLVHLLGRKYGGFALADAVLRPAHGVSRIGVQDVARHQPIEQHADRGQVLLHGGLGVGAAELLDVGGDVHGRHPGEVVQTPLRAPGGEALDGLEVGAPGVGLRILTVKNSQKRRPPSGTDWNTTGSIL